jgi:hypothetical protein
MKTKNNKKLKVLVAEGGSHYKILEQIFHLLSPHCSLHFYLKDTNRYNWMELFPSWKKTKVIKCGFKGIPLFTKLLLFGWRYDVINISTGPDGDHWTTLFSILPFYFVCNLYKRRIIFTFRNIYPYLKTTPGIFARLRNLSISKLKRFTFETRTVRDTFEKCKEVDEALLGVSYDRYSDVQLPYSQLLDQNDFGNSGIRIGLLGHISEKRRDYELLCDALAQITDEQRARLTLITMGFMMNAKKNFVIQKLLQYVKVDYQAGMLSEADFEIRGRSCHILLSALNHEKAYGSLFGTGSLGDAVYLRKKLIIPAFADPAQEFSEISYYYKTATDLSKIFKKLDEYVADTVPDSFYDKFTKKRVFLSLVKDLRLDKICKAKGKKGA